MWNKNSVTIDNELKLIAIAKRQSFYFQINDLLSKSSDTHKYTYQFKRESQGKHSYFLNFQTGEISKMTISIDSLTGHINYLEFINRKQDEYDWHKFGIRKTIIRISNFNVFLNPFSQDLFAINNIVMKDKKVYKGLPPYSNYTILDTTLKP